MQRRVFLTTSAILAARSLVAESGIPPLRFGLCPFSCHQRWKHTGAIDAEAFFHYARELGAEGIQSPLRGSDPHAIRALVEQDGGYYEGDLPLPRVKSDLAAFETSVRQTREAGATVARVVLAGGRRYERFKTRAEFDAFYVQARDILTRIEPILKRHRLKLAVENHKDLTSEELAAMMGALASEWIGVLVDTGNNLALLEEPQTTIERLAPFVLSVHLKDMCVQPDAEGFLLSETPLGTGFLNLKHLVAILVRSNPDIVLNLEMATRDPLRIPCLTDTYFATFPGRRETHLEAALVRVKAHPPNYPPPSVSGREPARILAEEEANNRDGFSWMRANLRT